MESAFASLLGIERDHKTQKLIGMSIKFMRTLDLSWATLVLIYKTTKAHGSPDLACASPSLLLHLFPRTTYNSLNRKFLSANYPAAVIFRKTNRSLSIQSSTLLSFIISISFSPDGIHLTLKGRLRPVQCGWGLLKQPFGEWWFPHWGSD
jgi:hypothetical protein